VDFLSKELGLPVEAKIIMDYTSLIEAMRYKHVEIAYFGPFSYVLANKVAGAEALAVGIRKGTDKSTYTSIIVTRKDTGINKVEDLRGRTFAFLDPASTSGYLIPMAHFKRVGIDVEKDLKSVMFAGSHEAVELAVYYGKADAGADNRPTFERMVRSSMIKADECRIIWESEPIPGSPVTVRKDLPEELKRRILSALLRVPEGVISFEGEMSRYERAYDSDYEIIRETARLLQLDI
jgi:phosphonate transport system substrate-binding protein